MIIEVQLVNWDRPLWWSTDYEYDRIRLRDNQKAAIVFNSFADAGVAIAQIERSCNARDLQIESITIRRVGG